MKLDLPWPPSVNHYWRFLPTGRGRLSVIITRVGRTYRSIVVMRCRRLGIEGIKGPARVWIYASRPDRAVRDLDNLNKAILDSLVAAGVLEDDKLAHDLRIVDTYELVNDGAIRVEIEPLEPREYVDLRT
jgi:crossover junction endodeoxyribonuclease RusA